MLFVSNQALADAANNKRTTESKGRLCRPICTWKLTNGGKERIKQKPRQKLWLQEKTVRAIATNKSQHVSTATNVTGNDPSAAKRASKRTMT